jgi:hypothetical protein
MSEADPIVELAQLAGQPAEVKTYGGRPVAVTPLKVREFGPMLKAVDPLFGDLAALGDATEADALMGLFARHTDAVLTAICIAARVDREWLDDQELDVPLDLFADVLAVNRDFFVARLQPLVSRLQTSLPAGSTSPSGLSAPGTATST